MQKVRSSRTVRLFLVGLAATLGLAVAVPRFGAPAEAQTICVGKQCGACGRSVPMSSQVGQRCPHCGAYWGYRRNKNVGTHYSAPPPPREVTIRYDDKTFDVPVVSSGGTVTVPVRTFERVGASVYWRPGEGITVSRAGRSVVIRLGSRTFQTVGTGSAGPPGDNLCGAASAGGGSGLPGRMVLGRGESPMGRADPDVPDCGRLPWDCCCG
jgi:hypothetical protein